MDLGLKDKVALVTGAGSQIGFGKAVCLTLAKEGCDIAVNDKNPDDAEKTAAEVRRTGRKVVVVPADVTKKDSVQAMVEKVLNEFGRIDILVNNAGGVIRGGEFLEQDEENWDRNINLNLKGAMFCSQAVIPDMMKRQYGKIVNITSSVVKMAFSGVSPYAIAKGANYVFTRGLAKQMITNGITINSVAPGWALTNFDDTPPDEIVKNFTPHTPIGRATTVQDIANTVAFLVSDVSADIVGQIICVDGGSTMQ
jgi:NAD(P)-dependent dehydrogenase (short-subunit alcohol dehydrogenase family)